MKYWRTEAQISAQLTLIKGGDRGTQWCSRPCVGRRTPCTRVHHTQKHRKEIKTNYRSLTQGLFRHRLGAARFQDAPARWSNTEAPLAPDSAGIAENGDKQLALCFVFDRKRRSVEYKNAQTGAYLVTLNAIGHGGIPTGEGI